MNDSLGIVQHPDFWSTVARGVRIYLGDIYAVSGGSITLEDGTKIPADTILCGTGWKPSYTFFSKAQLIHLGLPHNLDDQQPSDTTLWTELQCRADNQVLSRFPLLSRPPTYYRKSRTTTPYRLYNFIAPINDADRSIAFVGHVQVTNAFRAAECQAIWTTAYLDEQFILPSVEAMRAEVAIINAWCARRYLNNGLLGNYLHYDMIGYTDKLLKEVGLMSHRKSWWRDVFEPCRASDLAGLRDEYMQRYSEP